VEQRRRIEGRESVGERGSGKDRKRERERERVVGLSEGEREKDKKKFARSIFLSQLQCVEGFSDNPADKVHNSGIESFSF